MASGQNAVNELEALVERARVIAKSEDLLGALLGEINTALADILAQMEKPDPEDDPAPMAAALAQAFRLAMSDIKAPVVNLTPQIVVQPATVRELPPAQVVVNPTICSPAGTQHRIDIERDRQGRSISFTITKL